MKKRLLTLLLALTIATFPTFAFADSDKGESGNTASAQSIENEGDFEEEIEQIKEWVTLKDAIEAEKDGIESTKDNLELLKDSLEVQYEAAKGNNNLELAAELLAEIDGIRIQIDGYKLEMRQKIEDMHQVMKQQYTAAEWANLQDVAEELSADPTLTVLPVENIYFTGGQMKFDTPPVIKDGRTLIPIRSISTAIGADVTWNNDEHTATILYGDNINRI